MNKVNASADKMRVIRGDGRFDADKHFGPMSPEQIGQKASSNRTVNPQMAGNPNVQTAMGNAPPDMMQTSKFATGQTDTLPTGGSPASSKTVQNQRHKPILEHFQYSRSNAIPKVPGNAQRQI
jgi:hypothetical protein